MISLSRKSLVWAIALALVGCAGAGTAPSQTAAAPAQATVVAEDPVVYSFVFFGCNRLANKDAKAVGSTSTANVAQLKQDFIDIAKIDPAPKHIFLAGDVVAGMKKGKKHLKEQLTHWFPLATTESPIDLKKTRLIAFTGNHELLYKANDGKSEYPNKPAYDFWPEIMSPNSKYGNSYDFIGGHNGPGKGGADKLADDESALTYTLRDGEFLFIVLNTDSLVDDKTIGDIPLNWIGQQLQAAQKDPSIKHVFVMGHKPIVAPPPKKGKKHEDDEGDQQGARSILDDEAKQLNSLLNQPGSDGSPSKVRAYLAAHAHEWYFSATPPSMDGKVPQIVAGNGGSPPDGNWKNPDDYFGYTLVTMTRSGVISAQSFGRTIPQPNYYGPVSAPTIPHEKVELYPTVREVQ